ncbi:MAG: tetratricopeptide repeat protein [Acidobacteria bacterium]|nr:tetratricopeptide repeat protein [Acidobacteriota bacterium]
MAKREAFIFLLAGFIIGSFATFVVMKTLEQNKAEKQQKQINSDNHLSAINDLTPDEHFEMMQNFIKSAEENPTDIKSRITLGNIYYDGGKYDEAIKWYEEASKLNPLDTDVLVDLGACYRQKDPKKSIEYFDKALSVDPHKQQALYNKVIVYLFDLKDVTSAKESFEKLKRHYPNLPILAQMAKEIEEAEKAK